MGGGLSTHPLEEESDRLLRRAQGDKRQVHGAAVGKRKEQDDLEDLPEEGQRIGPNRYFAHIQSQGQWKQAIQGYLASIYFADTMLGRVMEALEKGPNADNTIVVLWSDHGWHLAPLAAAASSSSSSSESDPELPPLLDRAIT